MLSKDPSPALKYPLAKANEITLVQGLPSKKKKV